MNLSSRTRLLLCTEFAFTGLALGWLTFAPRISLGSPVEWFIWTTIVNVILNVQVLLLAIWAAVGRGSADVRLATASVTAALLLWFPALLYPNDDAWWSIATYLGGMLTTAILFLLQRYRWTGRQYPADAVPYSKPWQFSIKGILIVTTIVAILVAVRPIFTEILWNARARQGILFPVLNALQAVLTVWAVLREGRPTERIVLITTGVTLTPLLLFDQNDWSYTPLFIAIAFIEQCLLAGPLFVVRSLGYRILRKLPPEREIAWIDPPLHGDSTTARSGDR